MSCCNTTFPVQTSYVVFQVYDFNTEGSFQEAVGFIPGEAWLEGSAEVTANPAKSYHDRVIEDVSLSLYSEEHVEYKTDYYDETIDEIWGSSPAYTDYVDGYISGTYHNQIDENISYSELGPLDWFSPIIDEGIGHSDDQGEHGISTQFSFSKQVSEDLGLDLRISNTEFMTVEDLFTNAEIVLMPNKVGIITEDTSYADANEEIMTSWAYIFEDMGWTLLEQVDLISEIIEAIGYADTTTGVRALLHVLEESYSLQEVLKGAFGSKISEDMTYADQLDSIIGILGALIDGVTLDHLNIQTTVGNLAIENDISLADLLKILDVLKDTVSLLDADDVYSLIKEVNAEVFTVDDSLDRWLTAFAVVEEDVDLSQVDLYTLLVNGLASENIELSIGDKLLDLEYSAWVLYPETSAITNYDMTFTHSCTFHQDTLLADGNGLYKLDGTTDAGSDINSSITTASMNFGTSNLKNVDKLYLGTNSNALTIVARVENKYEARYRLTHADDFIGLRMVDLGKGLKGYLWQYQIQNVDNSEFDIDSIEILPMILRRKR